MEMAHHKRKKKKEKLKNRKKGATMFFSLSLSLFPKYIFSFSKLEVKESIVM